MYSAPVLRSNTLAANPYEALVDKNPYGEMTDQPKPKMARALGGDLGAMFSAAEGWDALNKWLESKAYSAGGGVTDIASKAMSPEAAGGLGYATNVGLQAIPAVFGGQLAKTMVSPFMQSAGKRMMQSALKPPIKERMTGEAADAVQTLLDEGASVTESGVMKLRQKADDLAKQIEAEIANSNTTINKGDVGKRLLDTLKQFKNQVNPNADIGALKKAWLEFRNHPDLIGKQQIPVQQAQSLKQGTYRALGDKPYGELQGASIEAQKQLARALKEEVANAVPSVAAPMSRQSDIINALKLAERRVAGAQNNSMLGLAPLGPSPLSWLLFLADRNPATVSALARMTNSGSSALPMALGQTGGALYGGAHMGRPDLYE